MSSTQYCSTSNQIQNVSPSTLQLSTSTACGIIQLYDKEVTLERRGGRGEKRETYTTSMYSEQEMLEGKGIAPSDFEGLFLTMIANGEVAAPVD